MSTLVRILDSSRTSREVRKVLGTDLRLSLLALRRPIYLASFPLLLFRAYVYQLRGPDRGFAPNRES
jgi:hypothetical protein